MKEKVIKIIEQRIEETKKALETYRTSDQMCRAMISRDHLLRELLKEISELPEQ